MTAIGSLRVELELADGSFTTRVIRAGTTLQSLETQLGQTVNAVRRLDGSMSSFGGGLRDMVVTLGLARAAVENLYTVFGKWLTSIVKINAEVERSITLLKNMSQASTEAGRLAEARKEFDELLTLSSQAPFRLETLTNAFVKLRAAGIEPAAGQLKSLANAVAAMGGTDEQFGRAAVAIQQMAGKGVISMEELRQQLGEAVPRALELMARSMNQSVSSFVQKVSQGQVEAKTALASLAAEFNRTFGGAAAAQMDTFSGKLVQLQTAWTRFALVVGGEPGSGGFFDQVKNFIQQLTDVLNSQEGQDFGARLNRNLTEMTKALTEGVRVLVDWSGTIETAARALLVFWVAVRGYAVLSGMLVAMNALRLRLLTLPAELAAATVSLNAFRNAAAGAAAVPLVNRLIDMTSAVASFGSALFGAVSRLSLFSRLLLGFGTAGVVIGALTLIGQAFDWIRGKADDATEALERFREGASDKETLKQVDTRIKAIDDEIAAEKELGRAKQEQLDRDKNNRFTTLGQMKRILDQLGEGSQPRTAKTYRDALEARENDIKAHNDRVIRLVNEQAILRAQLEGAQEERRERAAEQFASRELARLQGQMRQITSAYDQAARAIADRRAELAKQNLPTSEKEAAELALNTQKFELNKKLYDDQIKALDDFIKSAEDRREKAGESEKRDFDATLKRLRELRDQIERERAAGNLNGEITLMTANAENNIKVVQNEIARMNARIAEMRATIAGTNPELAQMESLIGGLTRMQGLPPDLKDQIRAVAEEFGNAKKELELFQKSAAGVRQIQTGFEKAATDVAFFKEKLEDIDLPDEERRFLQFERAMLAAFENVAAAADVIPEKVNAIRIAMLDAISAAKQASSLSLVTTYLEGQAADLAKLAPKGSEARLDAKIKILRDEQARMRAAAIRTEGLSGDDLAKTLDRIDDRFNTKVRLAQSQNGKEAEAAGRKTTNMLEQLKARYAELNEELEDGAGQFAKFWARLGNNRESAAGQEILAVAKDIDELTKRVEKAQNAWSTLKSLMRQGDEGRNELSSVFDILGQGRDPTSVEGPYLSAVAKAKRAIEDLRESGASAAAIMKAQNDQMEALPGIAAGALANQVTSWRNAQRQIREGLAETLTDRRRIAFENLAIEERSIRSLIDAAKLGADERKKIEDDLQEYLKARREQVERETEGPLSKMRRDWSNFSENIESSMVRAFDGMADALTEFVMTGKLNMNDLANSFIRDITRMAIKAAASGVFDLLKGGEGGGGGIKDFLSAGFDFIKGMFNHGGAVVGTEGKARSMPAALWANAPRMHKGGWLKDDEVPTILQKGEAVFTNGQLAELGRMNRSYAFVEQMLTRMASAVSAPPTVVPAMPMAPDARGGAATPGPVTVNIINQSGQPLDAVAGAPRMDLEGMIIDVVINNMQRPGRMRDAVKGVV